MDEVERTDKEWESFVCKYGKRPSIQSGPEAKEEILEWDKWLSVWRERADLDRTEEAVDIIGSLLPAALMRRKQRDEEMEQFAMSDIHGYDEEIKRAESFITSLAEQEEK